MRFPRATKIPNCPEAGRRRRETPWWLLTENGLASRTTHSDALRPWGPNESPSSNSLEMEGDGRSATDDRLGLMKSQFDVAYIHAWHPRVARPMGLTVPDVTSHRANCALPSFSVRQRPTKTRRSRVSGLSRRAQLILLSSLLICAGLVVIGIGYLIHVQGHPPESEYIEGEVAVADVQMRITNYNYTQDLQSPLSPRYYEFRDRFCSMISSVVSTATEEEELECEVLDLAPGSVIVRFVIIMTVHYGHTSFSTHVTQALEVDHISAAMEETTFELDIMGFKVEIRYVPLPASTADILADSRTTVAPGAFTTIGDTTTATTMAITTDTANTMATAADTANTLATAADTANTMATAADTANTMATTTDTANTMAITTDTANTMATATDTTMADTTTTTNVATTANTTTTGLDLTSMSPETTNLWTNHSILDTLTNVTFPNTSEDNIIPTPTDGYIDEPLPEGNETLGPTIFQLLSDSSNVSNTVQGGGIDDTTARDLLDGDNSDVTDGDLKVDDSDKPAATLPSPQEGSTGPPWGAFSSVTLRAACLRTDAALATVYGGWDLSVLVSGWTLQARCQCPCDPARDPVDEAQLLQPQDQDLTVCKRANNVPKFPGPPPRPFQS